VGILEWRCSHERAGTPFVGILVFLQWVLSITWTTFPDIRSALSPS
jgi:hypothetical protein